MHGDLNHTVQNTKHAPAQPDELELDIWLVLAGVLAVASGFFMIGEALLGGTLTPRLVGVGVVLDGGGMTGPTRGAPA